VNSLIRAIVVSTGAVRTLAGQRGVTSPFSEGVGSTATFNYPKSIALHSSGAFALIVSMQYYTLLFRDFCWMVPVGRVKFRTDSYTSLRPPWPFAG
jgi:hypothetical protein